MITPAERFGQSESYYQIAESAAMPYAKAHGLQGHVLDDLVQEGVLWLLERPALVWVREASGELATPLHETIEAIQAHYTESGQFA